MLLYVQHECGVPDGPWKGPHHRGPRGGAGRQRALLAVGRQSPAVDPGTHHLLFPFMPPTSIDDDVLRRLERVFSTVPVMEHSLVGMGWFGEDVLWLAPEDDGPFRSLTDAVPRELPAYPPFDGQFADVVPHLTTADRRPLDQMQSAERLVLRQLSIRCLARELSLVVRHDSSGRWTRSASFALGSASAK